MGKQNSITSMRKSYSKSGCSDVNESLLSERKELKSIEGNAFLSSGKQIRFRGPFCGPCIRENPKHSCPWLPMSWKAGHIAHDYLVFQSPFAQRASRGRTRVPSFLHLIVPSFLNAFNSTVRLSMTSNLVTRTACLNRRLIHVRFSLTRSCEKRSNDREWLFARCRIAEFRTHVTALNKVYN